MTTPNADHRESNLAPIRTPASEQQDNSAFKGRRSGNKAGPSWKFSQETMDSLVSLGETIRRIRMRQARDKLQTDAGTTCQQIGKGGIVEK